MAIYTSLCNSVIFDTVKTLCYDLAIERPPGRKRRKGITMRKEARQQQDIRVASVQGYHQGGYGSELYAFRGFNGNWYFNSDRKEKTELRDGTLYRVGKGGELLPFAGYGLDTISAMAITSAENITSYKNIYQYDILGNTFESLGFNSHTAWMANQFTADNDNPLFKRTRISGCHHPFI